MDSKAVFPVRINRITVGCMQRVKKYIHNLNMELKCVYDMKDGKVSKGLSGGGAINFLESGFLEWAVIFKRSQPLCQTLHLRNLLV